jgi:predicted aspartyl protease
MALIDTGASHTCIDEAIAQQLGLPVVNIVQVASASHASTTQNVYPVGIEVSAIGWRIDSPSVIGAPLAVQGIVLLIGRDILKLCTLIYNGFTGHITLAI